MKDFDLEQWLEREAARWYCKDQATIAKSSCLKGYNKGREQVLLELQEMAKNEFWTLRDALSFITKLGGQP